MLDFQKVQFNQHGYLAINYLDSTLYSNRVAVFGTESSGKSSLLRLIAGVEKPTSGSIIIDNNAINEIEKDVYFSFRDGGFLPNNTLEYNLAYPLILRGETKEKAKIKATELMEKFDLTNFSNFKMKILPFEEKARAILAKIKLRPTKMIILDNPFKMLENSVRADYFRRFLKLIEDYKGLVIYSTDNKKELEAFNEVILLNYGIVKAVGNLADITSNPTNLFSYEFNEKAKCFVGILVHGKDSWTFGNVDGQITINDKVASRIISEDFSMKQVIVAVRASDINITMRELESLQLKDLNYSDKIQIFAWNENSILR